MENVFDHVSANGIEYLVFTVFCSVLLTIVVVIRQVYFHPLSSVPGPLLAKICDAYSAYYSYRGDMHLDVQRCHQKYGDVIRYGPNRVLTLCPSDMNTIYDHGQPFRKSRGYETMIPMLDGWSTMTSIDKALHHSLRRTFRSGSGAKSLALFEPAILRNLKVYFSELTRKKDANGWSSASDMRAWNLCLGFDTMADFGLGIKTDLMRSSARDYVFPALHMHEKKMGLWEQWPFLNNIGIGSMVSRLLLTFSPTASVFNKWYQTFIEQAVANNTTQWRGIFGPVIQSGLGISSKPGHNHVQMIAEGAFSTFSSADAYGMMLCGFQHYLSHYPHVYDKLAIELRSRFKAGQQITWGPELESCAYLRACIDEVMRLLPPACGVHWRECEQAGVEIGDEEFTLPVGTDIGMSLFTIFRDGRIFRNPVLFWPERWTPGTLPEAEYNFARKMFTPFSIGPRQCAGMHVAIMIASISFTYLLVNYDFRLAADQHKDPPQALQKLSQKPGACSELHFESHYSIAGWKSGPFIQLRERASHIRASAVNK